jgi:predicted deacylase
MSHIGLIKGKAVKPERQFYFKHAPHVRALHAGYMVSNMQAEDVGVGKPTREVTKGEVLATIYNPYSLAEVEQIKAPCDGLLYACRVSGLVEPQNEVAAVADYRDSKWIE